MSTTETSQSVPTGDVLRALREGAGLSLRQLADIVSTPERTVTHGHIGRVESGERHVTPDLASRIARAVADRMAAVA